MLVKLIYFQTFLLDDGKMAEEVKSALTPKMWIILIALSVLMSIIGVSAAPFAPSWAWSTVMGSFTGPIVILFILLLISKALKLQGLNLQRLGLVYTVSAISLIFCWSMIPYGILHNSANMRMVTYDPYTTALADQFVFGPRAEVAAKIQTGGALNLVGEWAPWMGWWSAYAILWLVFWVGWLGLLHERWIEVEKLPFSAALTGTLQIQLIAGPEKDGRLKYFLVGVAIGALVILPIVVHALYPAFPDIYGWTADPYLPWWMGTLNLAGVPATAAIPVMSFLPVNPMIYALFLLFPTKILFSIWIFSLLGVIIPAQIAWYMGYYSGIQTAGWRADYLLYQEPFKYGGIWTGAFVGLALIWFVLNIPYMKSLFSKSVDVSKKAIAPMMGWIMIIVSTIGIIALLIVAGANPLGSVLIVFSMWLLYMGVMRVYGFGTIAGTAWTSPIDWRQFPYMTKYVWHPGMTTEMLSANPALAKEYCTTMMLTNRFTGEMMGEMNTHFGMVFAMPLCYKVGYDTGTHPRDITKLILVSGIISAVVGFTLSVMFDYAFGTSNTPMGMYDAWWIWVFAVPGTVEGIPTSEPFWPYLLAGIILSVVLSFLNFRFAWWPLDPAGVCIALGAGPGGWMLPALVGWIIKTVAVRMGGSKLHDNVIIPIAVGVLVGYWFLWFLGSIVGLIKFFIPA